MNNFLENGGWGLIIMIVFMAWIFIWKYKYQKRCRHCKIPMLKSATVCAHCGRDN